MAALIDPWRTIRSDFALNYSVYRLKGHVSFSINGANLHAIVGLGPGPSQRVT